MKFSAVARGTRAEKKLTVTLAGAERVFAIRALSAMEEIDAVSTAIALCKQKGSAADPGQYAYDTGLMAATLKLSCVDVDSPESNREAYFETLDDVLSLDTDTLASLSEQQALWQEEISPSYQRVSLSELMGLAQKLVREVEPGVPFDQATKTYLRLSPKTRLTLLHFMAALLSQLPDFKQRTSTPSDSGVVTQASDSVNESSNSPSNEPGSSESESPSTGG